MKVEWQDLPAFSLSEREMEVLQVIDEDDLTSFTFGGMKRRLGVHPETLSRILYRLEDQGILEKDFEGYRVTSKAKEFLGLHPLNTIGPPVSLLQTLLPPDVPTQQVISELRGRWFGVLRWLGYSENNESVTLKWVTDDGSIQVDANFSGDELNVEAKLLGEEDLNLALNASYQLIGYVSKIYSRIERINRIAYF